jgi:hypothetical protein
LLDLVRIFGRNLRIMVSNEELTKIIGQWENVNNSLSLLYEKMERDIQGFVGEMKGVRDENREISSRLQAERLQNASLIQDITMLRAELAKNEG